MKHLLILLSFLLLSSPLFGQSDEPTNLYRWEVDEKVYVWKIFGDEDLNPKYRGEVKEGKPDGLGITTFPDGSKYVGSYKNGKRHGRGTWFTKISGEIKPYGKGTRRYMIGRNIEEPKQLHKLPSGKWQHTKGVQKWLTPEPLDALEVEAWLKNYEKSH